MYLPLKDISNQARNHKDTDYDHVKKLGYWFLDHYPHKRVYLKEQGWHDGDL